MPAPSESNIVDEEGTKERWSGLHITERCARQEKWDISMRGKELVSFDRFASLRPAGNSSLGKDQVVIGVLCKRVSIPRLPTAGGEEIAELTLTDLHVEAPKTGKLTLTGRAVEHWARADSTGYRQCTVGSILAVLNPAATRPAGGMSIAYRTQILKLGVCPSLRFCDARAKDGLPCGRPYSAEGGANGCAGHMAKTYRDRQAHQAMTPKMRRRPRSYGAQTPPAAITVLRDASQAKSTAPRGKKRKAPEGSLNAATDAAEEASQRLAAAADGVQLLLVRLQGLQKKEGEELEGGETEESIALYEQVGVLVGRLDTLEAAAKRLRRSWRLLRDAHASTRGGA